MNHHNKYTIVIPTKNRSTFLNRILNYYATTEFSGYIYIGDSSNKEETKKNKENINKFKKLNVEIFGISRDNLKSHENFKAKYNFPFDLLSDPDEIACNLFNVIKMKNMYGKKLRGIERSTFLIGPKGNLVYEWRGVKVNGHINEILEILN